jgi:hypothetical protein
MLYELFQHFLPFKKLKELIEREKVNFSPLLKKIEFAKFCLNVDHSNCLKLWEFSNDYDRCLGTEFQLEIRSFKSSWNLMPIG